MEPYTKSKPPHLGRKVRGVRELRGMKQETMAEKLGTSQQAVSKLEQSEHIEDETLERIAGVLDVSVETIKNFNEDAIVYNIQNNYEGANQSASGLQNVQYYHCNFNPVDKWVEAVEKIEKLYEELLKKQEALTESEKEKVAILRERDGKGNKDKS